MGKPKGSNWTPDAVGAKLDSGLTNRTRMPPTGGVVVTGVRVVRREVVGDEGRGRIARSGTGRRSNHGRRRKARNGFEGQSFETLLEAFEVREWARAWEPTTPERAALFQRLRAEFPATPADGIMDREAS